jgi:hypothetical protein
MMKYTKLLTFTLFLFCFYTIILNRNELNRNEAEMNLIENLKMKNILKKLNH